MNEIEKESGLSLLVKYDEEGPFLVGGKCSLCQSVIFPKQSICPRCTGQDIKETVLSRKGKLYSYTEVHHKPPDYAGTVPYCIGRVRLPEGVFILAQLKADIKDLRINMEMELMVESIGRDESGNEKLGYKFKPR